MSSDKIFKSLSSVIQICPSYMFHNGSLLHLVVQFQALPNTATFD